MSEQKSKWLNVGSIIQFKDSSGNPKGKAKFQIDCEKLDELIGLMDNYFEKNVKGLSVDDIRAAQKLKWDDPNQLKRIELVAFEPSENAPDFIEASLCICRSDYE